MKRKDWIHIINNCECGLITKIYTEKGNRDSDVKCSRCGKVLIDSGIDEIIKRKMIAIIRKSKIKEEKIDDMRSMTSSRIAKMLKNE